MHYLCYMKIEQARERFVQLWGTLGSNWGINRTMAQVHALLLISPRALSTEEIMEELSISRGNANMNIRELINWNLIYKELKYGERKEYFRAEKDMWEVAIRVAQERRKREITPLRNTLSDMTRLEETTDSPEAEEFVKVVKSIDSLVGKLDKVADAVIKAEENWFFGKLIRSFK